MSTLIPFGVRMMAKTDLEIGKKKGGKKKKKKKTLTETAIGSDTSSEEWDLLHYVRQSTQEEQAPQPPPRRTNLSSRVGGGDEPPPKREKERSRMVSILRVAVPVIILLLILGAAVVVLRVFVFSRQVMNANGDEPAVDPSIPDLSVDESTVVPIEEDNTPRMVILEVTERKLTPVEIGGTEEEGVLAKLRAEEGKRRRQLAEVAEGNEM